MTLFVNRSRKPGNTKSVLGNTKPELKKREEEEEENIIPLGQEGSTQKTAITPVRSQQKNNKITPIRPQSRSITVAPTLPTKVSKPSKFSQLARKAASAGTALVKETGRTAIEVGRATGEVASEIGHAGAEGVRFGRSALNVKAAGLSSSVSGKIILFHAPIGTEIRFLKDIPELDIQEGDHGTVVWGPRKRTKQVMFEDVQYPVDVPANTQVEVANESYKTVKTRARNYQAIGSTVKLGAKGTSVAVKTIAKETNRGAKGAYRQATETEIIDEPFKSAFD